MQALHPHPLSDRDPNISGRTSRASNISAGSKGNRRKPIQRSFTGHHDMLSSTPGVTGMLRTTMEIGDVALLAGGSRGTSSLAYRARRPNALLARMTERPVPAGPTTQHHFKHHAWPSNSSNGRVRSITSNVTAPAYFDPMAGIHRSVSPAIPLAQHYSIDRDRSLSMTSSLRPSYPISHNRSYTSLRSRHDPYIRSRSPFRYPTRLKRPGFRPASPAMSDITGAMTSRTGYVAPKRLKPGRVSDSGFPQYLAAPYSVVRNRSAPTVTGVSAPQALRGTGVHLKHRGDDLKNQEHSIYPIRGLHSRGLSSAPPGRSQAGSVDVHDSRVEPHLSDPPTPTNTDTLRPIIIGNDFPQAVLAAEGPAYYDYTEDYGFEKEVTEVYNETMPDSPMPHGLLERIRILLQSNASIEKAHMRLAPAGSSPNSTPGKSILDCTTISGSDSSSTPVVRRITREMILQALAPSSEILHQSTIIDPPVDNPDVEIDLVENLAPSPDNCSLLQDNDDHSRESVSQSIYSRPTDCTETNETSTSTDVEKLIPKPLLTEVMQATARHAVLRRSISAGTGAAAHPSFVRQKASTMTTRTLRQPTESTLAFESIILGNIKSHYTVETSNYSVARHNLDRFEAQPRPSCSSDKVSIITTFSVGDIVPKDNENIVSTSQVQENALFQSQLQKSSHDRNERAIAPSTNVSPETSIHSITPLTTLRPLNPHASGHKSISRISLGRITSSAQDVPPLENLPPVTISDLGNDVLIKEQPPKSTKPDSKVAKSESKLANLRNLATQLPEVVEESFVDGTAVLHRSRGSFPNPLRRTSLVNTLRESARQSKEYRLSKELESRATECAPATQSIRSQSSVFKEVSPDLLNAHAIPSLNFSHINLLSKLNDAFEVRRSSYRPHFGQDALQETKSEQPHISASIQAKYRSLCLSFDDIATNIADTAHLMDGNIGDANPNTVPQNEETASTTSRPRARTLRPLSPIELIDEVNRISVPSLNGLTTRLSEMFPSLHAAIDHQLNRMQSGPIEATIKEIRDLGKDVPLAEEELVDEDWRLSLAIKHDAAENGQTTNSTAAGDNLKDICQSQDQSTGAKQSHRPISVLAHVTGNMARPVQNFGRLRSLSDSEVDSSMVERVVKSGRPAHRSLSIANNHPRPWNLDSSYPWSNSIPLIDIHVPVDETEELEISARNSQIHVRSLSEGTISQVLTALRIGDAQRNSVLGEASTSIDSVAPPVIAKTRQSKKISILGSLSRKVLGTNPGTHNGASSTKPSTIDDNGQRTRAGSSRGTDDGTVKPGDRYPTTGLPPPATVLTMDDVHSFFSDDSSGTTKQRTENQQAGSLRKRLTGNIRIRLPGQENKSPEIRPSNITPEDQVRTPLQAQGSQLANVQPSTVAIGTMTSIQEGTTSISETKHKRFVDRLKTFLARGGRQLLRTMSGRRRNPKDMEEDEDGWSENGESLLEWAPPQEYRGRTGSLLADIGPPGSRHGQSRTGSLLATTL